jgi:2-phosphoglycolate phosphatase
VALTPSYGAVLFDLDGTLIDTAPDMVGVLADLQRDEGHEPLDYDLARSHVSHGAAGLINLAFPGVPHEEHERLRLGYLERYEAAVCVDSVVFPGLDVLLDTLDAALVPWGIVTNKPMRMTDPLLAALGIAERAGCAVSGDTLPQRKPHPAPLFHACEIIGIAPEQSIYVGDAARDIEAGIAAGMMTVAATYGYITAEDDPTDWNAHEMVHDIEELTHLVLKGVNLGT